MIVCENRTGYPPDRTVRTDRRSCHPAFSRLPNLCFYVDEPDTQRQWAENLGAELVLHGTDEPENPLCTLADPAGHPFGLYTHPYE